MRVLVLGAIGLIGNNVLRTALRAGWKVVTFETLDRRGNRPLALQGLDLEMAPGHTGDPDALRQAMAGCDLVFHTQGYTPPNSLHNTRRLEHAREHIDQILQAAAEAHIGRLVYTSSCSTIGDSGTPGRLPDEWDHYRLGRVPHPFWDAKLIQEEAVLAFGRKRKIEVVVVNPSEIFGPYDFELSTVKPLIDISKRGQRQYMPGKVSIADVFDVAKGHISAAQSGRPGERYILAGHNISRREMIAIMARACKRPTPDHPIDLDQQTKMTRISEWFSCFGRPDRPFPPSLNLATIKYLQWYDSAKARDELGYTNRPFLETCRTTLEWLKKMQILR